MLHYGTNGKNLVGFTCNLVPKGLQSHGSQGSPALQLRAQATLFQRLWSTGSASAHRASSEEDNSVTVAHTPTDTHHPRKAGAEELPRLEKLKGQEG